MFTCSDKWMQQCDEKNNNSALRWENGDEPGALRDHRLLSRQFLVWLVSVHIGSSWGRNNIWFSILFQLAEIITGYWRLERECRFTVENSVGLFNFCTYNHAVKRLNKYACNNVENITNGINYKHNNTIDQDILVIF